MAARLSNATHQGGEETRAKIIEATLQTFRDEGIIGTTARAIAKSGGFNQALIFYHFGSVTDLLVAASTYEGSQRAARYAPRLESVSTLPELVAVARELHTEEIEDGGQNVLTQMLAGAASSESLRKGLMEAFAPWMQLVEDAVVRVLADTPYSSIVKSEDLSYVITSLFLGLELLHTLDPSRDVAPSLFTTFEALAQVIESVLHAPAKKKR